MDHDLNAAVEDFRRRIQNQAEEVQKLLALVFDLETQDSSASGRNARSARRARSDLDRAKGRLGALKREYARFRLVQAIGQDPAHVETELFDEELMATTDGPLTRREPRHPSQGRIAFETFRTMLLADLPLGQVAENEHAERRSDIVIELLTEETGTKNILRQWGTLLQPDPYVAGVLRRAAAATAQFTTCLEQFATALDSLRIHYELKQRKVDSLTFTMEGSRPAIQASNYWENIEQVCSAEAAHLLEQFLGLDQARRELRRLRDELNDEIRAYMRVFVPRYVAYVTKQTRARRQSLGLARFGARRLCAYLLDETERTDFLLPRGSAVEIGVPRTPRNIAAFGKTRAFRRYKKALHDSLMADASTVEHLAE